MADIKCDMNPLFIEQFIDGELPYEESAEISNHLKECESCRQFYNSTISLKEAIAETAAGIELSMFERKGIERLIDESGNTFIETALEKIKSFVKSTSFISATATAALSATVFFFVFSLTSIESDKSLMTKEILNIHKTQLPCDMCGKENIEKLVKAELEIEPKIQKYINNHERVKGRFSHLGAVPVASIKIEDKDETGTLLLSRDNKTLKKLFTAESCLKETDCRVRQYRKDGHDMLFWERGRENYLFVTDSPRLKSNMVRLIDAR